MKYACNIPHTLQIAPYCSWAGSTLARRLAHRYLLSPHGCGKLRRHRIRRSIFAILTLLPLASATGHTEVDSPLNSDLIRQRFGNYQVDVLRQSERSRVANLYSITAGAQVCRTLAVTHFVDPVDTALVNADKRIRSGESIGATLRSQGFEVSKRLLIETEGAAGSKFEALAPGVAPGTILSIKVYVLSASAPSGNADYAVIAEAYHPEHTPPLLSINAHDSTDGGLASTAELALSDLMQQI